MKQLRSYQEECITSIFDYFATNTTGMPLCSLPTATGKSLIIAAFIQRVFQLYPNQRIIVLVHVKELVQQDTEELLSIWPMAPVGIHCAGLNQKDVIQPIIFGSLGSARNNIMAFGYRDLLIIDESHCVSPDEETGYRKIIDGLSVINPTLRVIGMSATNFRLGQGCLTDNGFFTDICFDITGVEAFNRLIAEGYLAPLISRPMKTELDVSSVAISKGDFNQGALQKAVDKQEITYAAIQEAIEYGHDRVSWLVFASGIEHAEHITSMLQSFGISAEVVHSKITDDERDERILAFKTGKIRALVGFRIMTTGFNHPPVDFIIDLYPTVSPGLHVQKYGRGTRVYKGTDPNFPQIKKNCLILDYSGNVRRLGCINDPVKPRKKGDKTGDIPVKICDACSGYNHISARWCGGHDYPSDEGCGAEFIFKTKLVRTAGELALLAGDSPVIETYEVTKVIYHKHNKIGMPPSMKVSYYCGLQRFSEYVCLEHIGMVRTRAFNWWRQRHASEPPTTIDEALLYSNQLRCPKRIRVQTNMKWPQILSTEW